MGGAMEPSDLILLAVLSFVVPYVISRILWLAWALFVGPPSGSVDRGVRFERNRLGKPCIETGN